jgi:S1-C subfamily serine protease
MNTRIWKILGWTAALLLVLGIGAAAGGGIVYAMTRAERGEALQLVSEGPLDTEPGVVIASVVPDGPADEAGVKRGDILLQVDDEAVDDAMDLVRVLGGYEPGDEVALTVLHGDDERTLEATLGERDDRAYLGVVPCGAPMDVGRAVSVFEGGPGAVIVEVEVDSPADEAGLQEGDVVVAVDGQELSAEETLVDVIGAYDPGDTVTLDVKRSGFDEEAREVTVELGQHPDDEEKAYLGVKYRPSPPFKIAVVEAEKLPFEPWRHIRPFGGGEDLHLIPEGEEVQGAIIRRVEEDSPAEGADLHPGDVLTAIDGDPLEGPGDLVDRIAEHEPGDRVTLTVRRFGDEEAGKEREIEVTLAEDPDQDEEGKAYLGVVVGGFIHVSRLGDGEALDEFELQFEEQFDALPERFEFHFPHEHLDLEIPFDEFDIQLDNIEKDFDFEFSIPPELFDSVEMSCCEGSV